MIRRQFSDHHRKNSRFATPPQKAAKCQKPLLKRGNPAFPLALTTQCAGGLTDPVVLAMVGQ
jgi:hypothetical protein